MASFTYLDPPNPNLVSHPNQLRYLPCRCSPTSRELRSAASAGLSSPFATPAYNLVELSFPAHPLSNPAQLARAAILSATTASHKLLPSTINVPSTERPSPSMTLLPQTLLSATYVSCPCPLHVLLPHLISPQLSQLVDEFVVRCPQQPLGCSYTCQRLLLPAHLNHACQFIHLPCPEARCAQPILRKDLKDHHCSNPPTDTSATSNNSSETRSHKDPEDKVCPHPLSHIKRHANTTGVRPQSPLPRLQLQAPPLANLPLTWLRRMPCSA